MFSNYRPLPILLLLFVSGCGGGYVQRPAPDTPYLRAAEKGLVECAQLFVDVETAVAQAGVADQQAVRLSGFPYLRVTRFLASFAGSWMSEQAMGRWLHLLRQEDLDGRRNELRNLATSSGVITVLGGVTPAQVYARIMNCGERLLQRDMQDPKRLTALRTAARVPPSYNPLARVVGLYPISKWFVSRGVYRLQQELAAAFASPADGDWLLYTAHGFSPMQSARSVAELWQQLKHDALGIPVLEPDTVHLLLQRYAPVLRIDTRSSSDRIGVPVLSREDIAVIDISDPVVYGYLSHTRYGDQTLLQLNYVFWFPERPLQGSFDLLGGNLDGLTWRLTLATNGRPLIYDAIHNCGCYHVFFPLDGVSKKPDISGEEPVFAPIHAPALAAQQHMEITIAANSHYIRGLRAIAEADGKTQYYAMQDYDVLRSLPRADGGRRSLFDNRGLIAGSSRKERWLLWPMGVVDPGAMRQRGHHATAFVGQRHFDDAHLLERYFNIPAAFISQPSVVSRQPTAG